MIFKYLLKYFRDLIRLKFNTDGNSKFGKLIFKIINTLPIHHFLYSALNLERNMTSSNINGNGRSRAAKELALVQS